MRYADCSELQKKVVDAYPDQDVASDFKVGTELGELGDSVFHMLINDAEDDEDALIRRMDEVQAAFDAVRQAIAR
jgi:hypothetical protein